jgi:hypothetical protein
MAKSLAEYKAIRQLQQNVSDSDLKLIYASLELSYYLSTRDYVSNGYSRGLLKQDIGGIRRPMIRQNLKATFLFNQNVVVTDEDTDPKGYNYCQLNFRNKCIVNLHYVRNFNDFPRLSAYVRENARHNPRIVQLPIPIFQEEQEDCSSPQEGIVNAIITHGSSTGEKLDFAFLRMPDFDFSISLHSRNLSQIAATEESTIQAVHDAEPEKLNVELKTTFQEDKEDEKAGGMEGSSKE